MRAIVVDDEYETLEEIKDILRKFSDIDLVGAYQNPLLVMGEIDTTQPDCAFVDIEMPGLSGIELAEAGKGSFDGGYFCDGFQPLRHRSL